MLWGQISRGRCAGSLPTQSIGKAAILLGCYFRNKEQPVPSEAEALNTGLFPRVWMKDLFHVVQMGSDLQRFQ